MESFFNFNASLNLIVSLSRRGTAPGYSVTAAQEHTRRSSEESALNLCMGVLSYCAKQDRLAQQYLQITNNFRSILVTYRSASSTSSVSSPEGFAPPVQQPEFAPFGPAESFSGQSTSGRTFSESSGGIDVAQYLNGPFQSMHEDFATSLNSPVPSLAGLHPDTISALGDLKDNLDISDWFINPQSVFS